MTAEPLPITRSLRVFVAGHPAPQGSKNILQPPGRRASLVESSKRVKPWREDVRAALLDEHGQPWRQFGDAAVAVRLEFVMPRPTSTPKRRTPPAIRKPDVDKLARALLDAITSAGVVADDARVVDLHATKRLAEIGETPGCHILIAAAQQPRGATNPPTAVSPAPTGALRRSEGAS